jgi:uncharacterized protein
MPKPGAAKTESAPSFFAKNGRLLICLSLAVAVGAVLAFQSRSHNTNSACGPYRTDKIVTISSQRLNAEVANNPTTRAKGLGGRPCIETNQAMLFVFDRSDTYSMWMKDMKFPIDMVWVSANHRAVAVQHDIAPSTYPDSYINKDQPALYVLELQAGRSQSLHIGLGTPINF